MNAYAWQDFVLGVSAEFRVKITEDMMSRFCDTTGDVNPLHVDQDHAAREGFPGRVVYGLLTASFYSTLAGVHLPGRDCLLHGLTVGFHKPVYVGDELVVRGEVVYRNESCRQAEIACQTFNQRGERVSTGKLKVGVRSP